VVALIDTSAVLAAVDRADPAHEPVVASLALERSSIVLPVVVLPEVAYLVEKRHGASAAASVMGRLVRGRWPILGLEPVDLARATELMTDYADARIGFVDAGVAALAERLGAVRIYTLDRRDFSILRPRHTSAFEVLPEAATR
jgi:predicted nucleic acid-binding protein